MVNIAQPFKSSGLMLTCRKDAGIESTADFRGKTLGVWFFGNEFPFPKLDEPTRHPHRWFRQMAWKCSNKALMLIPILNGQAACVSTMSYNEYWQIIDAGVKPIGSKIVQI